MSILSMFALGIGFRTSIELRLSKYNLDRLEAAYLARAGIKKASEFLLRDSNEYDSLYECGITLAPEETPEIIFGKDYNKLGNGSFSIYYNEKNVFGEKYIYYGIQDEERRININTASAEVLQRLSDRMTPQIASSIVIWRSPAPDEEEDAYYEALEPPYKCRHDRFTAIEELKLVRGVTEDLYEGIKDYITVFGDGKININTAPKEVLNAIIDDGTGEYESLIYNIIESRKSDDGFFTNIDVFLNYPEDDEMKMRLTTLKNNFTTKSDFFRINAYGEVHKAVKAITYIAKKDPAKRRIEIKYYHEE